MNKEGVSALKIAGTYIGTVVGAGFATGQEVLQFFLKYGFLGIAGLLISTAMFIAAGYYVMDIGSRLDASSYREIVFHTCGRLAGTAIDWVMTFFLFGALAVMIAGTGALFSQQLYLPELLGCVLMAGLTAATVLTGFKGVINSISLVAPFMMVSVAVICVISIAKAPPDIFLKPEKIDTGLSGNWLVACVLYVSYNILLSVAVLGPLGAGAKGISRIRSGSVLGGLGLGAASLMIYLAMAGVISKISGLEIPMLYIAGRISPGFQFIFALVLVAEIYTTAVSSLFGFVSRFKVFERSEKGKNTVVIGASLTALLLSRIGFSNLVRYLYPIIGYCGIVFLACLIYTRLKHFPGRRRAAGKKETFDAAGTTVYEIKSK